jgi:hypothetical protein
MGHYAKVEDNLVTRVIVAEPEFFESFVDSSPGEWLQCSYNDNIRKNYPGIGYTYDSVRDAFIPPKPHTSWALNETTCRWEAPVEIPDNDTEYTWNEDNQSWDEVE